MSNLAFSAPPVMAALEKRLAAVRAKGTPPSADERWTWAMWSHAIPIPPSSAALGVAGQLFDVARQYGTSSPTFSTARDQATRSIASMRPGWLGSILSAIAVPAVVGITSVVGAGLVKEFAGGSSGIPPAPALDPTRPIVKKLPDPIGILKTVSYGATLPKTVSYGATLPTGLVDPALEPPASPGFLSSLSPTTAIAIGLAAVLVVWFASSSRHNG